MHTLTFCLSQATVKGALPRGSVTKGNGRLYVLASFRDPNSLFFVFRLFCLSQLLEVGVLAGGCYQGIRRSRSLILYLMPTTAEKYDRSAHAPTIINVISL